MSRFSQLLPEVVKVVFYVFLILLLFGGIFFGFSYWINQNENVLISGATLNMYRNIGNTLIGAVLLIFAITLTMRLAKFFIRHSTVFGERVSSRIIALGVTAMLFYKSFYAIVAFPLLALLRFVFSVFKSINRQEISTDIDDEYLLTDSVTSLIKNWWLSFVDFFDQFIAQIPVKNAFLGLLALYVIGKLADYLADQDKPDFQKVWSWLSARRENFLLAILFITGGFLSFSALIAIPYIEEGNTKEGMSLVQFDSVLNESNIDNWTDNFYHEISAVPYDSFETEFKDVSSLDISLIDSLLGSYYTSNNDNVQSFLSNSSIAILSINNDWKAYTKVVVDKIRAEKQVIRRLFEFSTKKDAIGSERIQYSENLIIYYHDYVQFYYGLLTTKLQEIKHFENENDITLKGIINATRRNQQVITLHLANTTPVLPRELQSTYPALAFRPNLVSVDNYYNQRPGFGRGATVGVFGLLSNWLLPTKSNEMAIIVGMLGFGILGAGISAIIRSKSNNPKKSIFRDSVSSTVVGGISAAFVIFLSAKGGAALFNFMPADLNEYVLFGICLAGSVYSEKIWDMVYARLNKNLENGSLVGGGIGGAGGEAAKGTQPVGSRDTVTEQTVEVVGDDPKTQNVEIVSEEPPTDVDDSADSIPEPETKKSKGKKSKGS